MMPAQPSARERRGHAGSLLPKGQNKAQGKPGLSSFQINSKSQRVRALICKFLAPKGERSCSAKGPMVLLSTSGFGQVPGLVERWVALWNRSPPSGDQQGGGVRRSGRGQHRVIHAQDGKKWGSGQSSQGKPRRGGQRAHRGAVGSGCRHCCNASSPLLTGPRGSLLCMLVRAWPELCLLWFIHRNQGSRGLRQVQHTGGIWGGEISHEPNSGAWGQRHPWEIESPRNIAKSFEFPQGEKWGFQPILSR